ncbi:uncharacterized protein LOC122811483 isoform X1 [Protopterus annectens]|uniref:uncharacterized protein LOC122811483 isoform X1 n=1 Tax=Protopterus annectens TaxID=7888 RepID=UPI001CFA3860|nr:uncharacterized protein LOC122811483 isoform X1 [Protopterus annectens]
MVQSERRQDLHLTSTGTGLRHTEPPSFPPSFVRTTIPDELPPELRKGHQVSSYDEVINRFQTTAADSYDRKTLRGVVAQPHYPKPPPHWTVAYTKDLSNKLSEHAWKTPLTMGHQTSEMKAKYTEQPALFPGATFNPGPQPFGLATHHAMEHSKNLSASMDGKSLGRPHPSYIWDKPVLGLNNIYLTTTSKDIRPYKKEELEGYPKKDILTYWQSEDYPKAWGHGLKDNPFSKEAQQIGRNPHSMQDSFPTTIKMPRVPPRLPPVPHRGLKTLVQESYQWPADVKRKQDVFCPIETPWTIPHEGPLTYIMSVPKMYETEYQTYGSSRPVTV